MWTKTAVHLDATPDRPEGWHYAQVWKTGGHQIGFCADHAPHPTEAEARECYSAYLRTQLREETYGDWSGCEASVTRTDQGSQALVCDTPTKKGITYSGGFRGAALCDRHRTDEQAIVVLGLDQPAGDSFGS